MENTSTLQKAPKKGLNTAILILQFIGIVAVVLGHADGPGEDVPNFLTLAFPYYSWHMPFFIFISGYLFNREQTAGRYILKKVKTHLIPALIVNAICGIFAVCIKAWHIAKYGAESTSMLVINESEVLPELTRMEIMKTFQKLSASVK